MFYRPATPADAKALADFAGRLFVESYQQWTDPAELQDYVATQLNEDVLLRELQDTQRTTFLAFGEGDELVGYAQVTIGDWPECDVDAVHPAQLKRIYVDRRWQGRHIAAELLARVEATALQHNCDVIWLAVWEINERAIAFYEKHRFHVVGRQGFMGSTDPTDYVMAKKLAGELQ